MVIPFSPNTSERTTVAIGAALRDNTLVEQRGVDGGSASRNVALLTAKIGVNILDVMRHALLSILIAAGTASCAAENNVEPTPVSTTDVYVGHSSNPLREICLNGITYYAVGVNGGYSLTAKLSPANNPMKAEYVRCGQ